MADDLQGQLEEVKQFEQEAVQQLMQRANNVLAFVEELKRMGYEVS